MNTIYNFFRKMFGLCIHDWTKYSEPEVIECRHYPYPILEWKYIDYTKTVQYRKCKKCNIVEKKYL